MSLFVFVLLLGSIVLLGIFIFVEKRVKDFVIMMYLFKNLLFVVVNLVVVLVSGFLMGIDVYIFMWM